MRLRRQVRRIRLNHNSLERQSLRNLAKVLRFRIGQIPRKRNQEAHVHAAPRVFERAAEAVQNSADTRGFPMPFQQIQAIAPGIAAMNDDG
jgi:hypothetical protein